MSCDADGVVKLWDLRLVCERATINCGPYPANKACFDHTGKFIYVASDDGTVKAYALNLLCTFNF
jgi:WD40 repeat protein